MEFKIKEYELRFIIDRDIRLNHYVNVSLTTTPPTIKEDFYWIDSIKYDPLGFMYHLDGIDEMFHGGSLFPLLPVIVSNEILRMHDLFYYDGKIQEVAEMVFDEDEDRWLIIDINKNVYNESDVYKVIVLPEHIGWVYNEGPMHDHNYSWVDSRYLEVMHPKAIIDCVKNNFKITIVVDEKCVKGGEDCMGELRLVPHMHEGKVIIDGYGLLKNSSSVFVY